MGGTDPDPDPGPGPDPGAILDWRTLNRTLLRRQRLLGRERRPALDVIDHLVGLQAQEPRDPYVALWSRIEGFDPTDLADALTSRRVVRMGLMRGTLHLVTAADARTLYPAMHDVLARPYRTSPFARSLGGADTDAITTAARALLEREPLSPADLGHALAERWPELDPTALAYTARYLLPLVQVPPRGLWDRSGRTVNTTAEAWLGGPLGAAADMAEIVSRYLRAFGPATVADIRAWSRLTGLGPTIARMRPGLVTYRDPAGRELLDLPGAPIEDPDRPVPVRFLPQYDNAFLAHADRARINGAMPWGLEFGRRAPVLIDGSIDGAWRLRRERDDATLTIDLARRPGRDLVVSIETEAAALLDFLSADAISRSVRIAGPD